jgi:hypothetical protein
MSKIRFLYDNVWADAGGTVAATSEASALSAAASQNPDRSYVWRSLSQVANQALTRDLGSSKAATCVAVANVKRQNAGTLKLQEAGIGAGPGAWNDVATIPVQDAHSRVSFAFFNSLSARHWRLLFLNGNGALADTAEVGYVHLGTYFEPTYNIMNPEIHRFDPSVGRASVDGQSTFAQRSPFDYGDFNFDAMPEADLNSLQSIYHSVGNSTPFFVVLDTALPWMAWLLRFSSPVRSMPVSLAPIGYDVGLSWTEAR